MPCDHSKKCEKGDCCDDRPCEKPVVLRPLTMTEARKLLDPNDAKKILESHCKKCETCKRCDRE